MTTSKRLPEPDLSQLPVFDGPYWRSMDLLDALPGTAPLGTGYLYVVGFSTGVVKVGLTTRPRARMGDHIHAAHPFGVFVQSIWMSEAVPDFSTREQRLIRAMQERYGVGIAGVEYFHDADFAEAVTIACRIVTNT